MTALMIRPEWYIVNTVGVLVGAGVIVMLGVTFVPTLIVIFMILVAIYDAWAVYRSKAHVGLSRHNDWSKLANLVGSSSREWLLDA